MLSGILSESEETMANGTNPQKKHLIRRVGKKVLIHDRRTIEVWYCLPYRASVRTAEYLAPRRGRISNFCRSVSLNVSNPPPDNFLRIGTIRRQFRGRTASYLRSPSACIFTIRVRYRFLRTDEEVGSIDQSTPGGQPGAHTSLEASSRIS